MRVRNNILHTQPTCASCFRRCPWIWPESPSGRSPSALGRGVRVVFSPDRASRLAALVDQCSPLSRLSRAQGVCALCEETTGATGVALSVAEDRPNHLTSTVCGTDE